MTQLSAYATDAQYRARMGDQTTGTNATLNAQLLGVSRLLEFALSVMPGAFNTHAGTYVFTGFGGSRLALRDGSDVQYFLTAITADSLKVDADGDGSYDDYLLDLDDLWVDGFPENAAAISRPFTAIDLRPIDSATITSWPSIDRGVQITGTWGWAAVPDLITDLVCHRTSELRESLKDGGTDRAGLSMLPSFGDEVRMRPQTAWMWKEAERLYGRRIPVFA